LGVHGWFSQPLLSHQNIKIAKAIAGRRGATGAAAGVVAAGVVATAAVVVVAVAVRVGTSAGTRRTYEPARETAAVIRSPSIFEGTGDQMPSSSLAIVAVAPAEGRGKERTAAGSNVRFAGVTA